MVVNDFDIKYAIFGIFNIVWKGKCLNRLSTFSRNNGKNNIPFLPETMTFALSIFSRKPEQLTPKIRKHL